MERNETIEDRVDVLLGIEEVKIKEGKKTIRRIRIEEGKELTVFAIFVILISMIFSAVIISLLAANSGLSVKNEKLQSVIVRQNNTITKLSNTITQKEKTIDRLAESITKKDERITQLIENLTERDKTITQRDKTISGLNQCLLDIRKDYEELAAKSEFPSPPEIIGEISNEELSDFLRNYVGSYETSVYLEDYRYELTTVSEIKRFLEWDKTDEFYYQKEGFDCDDFAARLYGQITIPGWSEICFGEIWSGNQLNDRYHSCNLFITKENGELMLYSVEPQNDFIQKITSLEKVVFVKFG